MRCLDAVIVGAGSTGIAMELAKIPVIEFSVLEPDRLV